MTDRAELFRALGVLAEPPGAAHRPIAESLRLRAAPSAEDFASLFLFQAYPYASVYIGPEGMLGGEARDRVAGFWRALGLVPPPEPDHVATLLGLYGSLIDAEAAAGDPARAALRRSSRSALLWEHLLSWLPPWLAVVDEVGPAPYRAWAAVLDTALREEARDLGPQDLLPLHLRMAPGLPPDDASLDEWVAALVAPVRTGMLLTRTDLRRAARDLGIGTRVGERGFMLRALLDQDASGTARWLAQEARRWAGRHRAGSAGLGAVAVFWAARADASAVALAASATAAPGMRTPAAVPSAEATTSAESATAAASRSRTAPGSRR